MASRTYTHPTEKWTLRGDAAASYLRMRAAGHPAGGIDVYSRTMAQQAELRRRYLSNPRVYPVAAAPSKTAPHIDGRAMDYRTGGTGKYAPSDAHVWASHGTDGSKSPRQLGKTADWSDRAAKYGFGRTVPSERWHREYSPAKDKRRAAGLKAALKTLGFPDLKAFQRSRKITADGIDGPHTWTEILRALDRIKPKPPRLKLGDRVLKRGDSGPDVAELSKLLTARGHDVGTPVDQFGPAVERAVRSEQTAGRLTVDGKVGKDTLAWLRKPIPAPEPPKPDPVVPPVERSHNGWPVVEATPGTLRPLPAVSGAVLVGDVWEVFMWLAREYVARVEPINRADSWGWDPRKIAGSEKWSNHASGTAVDFNGTAHPMNKRGTMTAAQTVACRAIQQESGGVLRWGEVIPDEMHWEIAPGVTPQQVAAFAAKIREETKK